MQNIEHVLYNAITRYNVINEHIRNTNTGRVTAHEKHNGNTH